MSLGGDYYELLELESKRKYHKIHAACWRKLKIPKNNIPPMPLELLDFFMRRARALLPVACHIAKLAREALRT